MIVSSIIQKFIPNFEVRDVKIDEDNQKIIIFISELEGADHYCTRCGHEVEKYTGKYPITPETMPIFGYRCYLSFMRKKFYCPQCKKSRAQALEFISDETPHLTADFSYWMGKLCEISAVAQAAKLMGLDAYSTWRADYRRMNKLNASYKSPKVTKISVDEVYVRKHDKFKGESRSKRFFTIISDLDTRKVIWVSEGRSKKALDDFYEHLGEKACKKIKVVAMDQYKEFLNSTKEHCPNATIVWDRFHLMQNFNKALNDERKRVHQIYKRLDKNSDAAKFTNGRYRYLFLKKASRRTIEEEKQMDFLIEKNEEITWLEIIKEKMSVIFDCNSADECWNELMEMKSWMNKHGFEVLIKWINNLIQGWDTFKNYFKYKVTSSLSEGINNKIKVLIRKAYGYKNMDYLKLKIMQQCGYLNSNYFDKHGNFLLT